MTRKQLLLNLIVFFTSLIAIYGMIGFPSPFTNLITSLQNTTFWWFVMALTLMAYSFYNYYYIKRRDIQNMKVVQWYIFWNIICIFRGLFIAENYWDWKGLVGSTFAFLIPIMAVTVTNKIILQSILSFYVKFTLPFFILVAFLISYDAYGFYLVPISFLMLFFPVLPNRWKYIVAAFTLLVMTIDMGARSNVLKFGVPVIMMLIYYIRNYISDKYFEIVRILFMIIPIILFSLGVSGIFNVFKMDEYIKGDYNAVERDEKGNIGDNDLKADTRTFIYVEVLYTAKVFNSWIIGRSPARGNLSESFGDNDETGRHERLGNEVGILNVFTSTGIVGILLLLFVFYKASYIAVNHSNNIFSKIIGLIVAFRWAYSWVEDINNFSLNYIMLWIMIGVCFSKSFRNMTNREMTYWVRGIFNISYAKIFK